MAYFPPTGSVVAFQSQPSSLLVGASIIGLTPVNVVNMPSSSVISYQLAGSVMAVSGNFTSGNTSVTAYQGGAWSTSITSGYLNVIGSVLVAPVGGTPITSLVSTVPSSVQVGASIMGTVPVTQTTSPWIVNVPTPSYLSIQPGGSVLNANISGSVAAAVINFTASVAANINVISASIVTNQGTNPWVIGSIVGTYAENSAATAGGVDKGVFVLGVRNDTMSSVTGADLDYTAHTVGPVGETIVANAPITKWVQGVSSVFTGSSVQVLAPQGSSVFTYITGLQVANASANPVYLTFTGGLGGVSSILGYTVAPANGGSNIVIPNAWKTGQNSGFSASVSGVSSIYLAVEGFISKT